MAIIHSIAIEKWQQFSLVISVKWMISIFLEIMNHNNGKFLVPFYLFVKWTWTVWYTALVKFSLCACWGVYTFEIIIWWSDLVVSIYISLKLIFFISFNKNVCFVRLFTNRIFDWIVNYNSKIPKRSYITIDFISGLNIGIVCVSVHIYFCAVCCFFYFFRIYEFFFSKIKKFVYRTNWFSDWIAHNRHNTSKRCIQQSRGKNQIKRMWIIWYHQFQCHH